MNAVIEDEAVAEPVEEEVSEIEESVDTDEDEDVTESEVAESEESAKKEEESEPSESSTEKKDDGFQKRIDELTQRYYEEKTQREHFQQQWEDSQKPEVLEPGKTLADFNYDEDQFSMYNYERGLIEAKAKIEQDASQKAQFKRRATFEAKEAAFAKTVDDYHKVAHYSPISQEVASVVMSAEKAPELAYYLGKNPELAASLSSMSILDAAREIGRIEATKLVKPETSKKSPAEAVPKIKATDSGSGRIRSDMPESDKLSTEEWKRRELKRMANRNK